MSSHLSLDFSDFLEISSLCLSSLSVPDCILRSSWRVRKAFGFGNSALTETGACPAIGALGCGQGLPCVEAAGSCPVAQICSLLLFCIFSI